MLTIITTCSSLESRWTLHLAAEDTKAHISDFHEATQLVIETEVLNPDLTQGYSWVNLRYIPTCDNDKGMSNQAPLSNSRLSDSTP